MTEEILINVTPHDTRIALVENNQLQEFHMERNLQSQLLGNIYKGKVRRLLPGIQAAFIDIGLEKPGFLHISDIKTKQTDINECLRVGQTVWVQVYKNPLGSKGPRLTTQLSIVSTYLILTIDNDQILVSQKIVDKAERERLFSMIKPGQIGGFIIRTSAQGKEVEQLKTDQENVERMWEEILNKMNEAKEGECVYQEMNLALRILRDFGFRVSRMRVDDEGTARSLQYFAQKNYPHLADKIEFYHELRPIFDIYGIEDEIQNALQRKIFLKSGGFLVFDQTEALITIDVNTGSHVGKNAAQMILKTNLEAAKTIARQLRLRNLGGIIIIDFIDMTLQSHKNELMQTFKASLDKDSVRTEICELTTLGLLQITRKRSSESLEHILCVTCPLCERRGFVKSIMTITQEIFQDLQRSAALYSWPGFQILANSVIIESLLANESQRLSNLEVKLGKPIQLQVESSYKQDHFDILPWSKGLNRD